MQSAAESTSYFRKCGVARHSRMNKVVSLKSSDPKAMQADARQLRRAGKRIAASRRAALRLLAATGMYTLKGQLKPQFR